MSLKKLAGQTMWYGVSNIAARLLTYLLTPYITYTLTGPVGDVEYGLYTLVYSVFPFLNIVYAYGMETTFFRFSNTEDKQRLYSTQVTSVLITTVIFTGVILMLREPIAGFLELGKHIEYVGWGAAILGMDALSALPYARLRQENRPRKYAFIKVAGIILFVGTIIFLFSAGKNIATNNPEGAFAKFYNEYWGLGFILFANVLQSLFTLVLLSRELLKFQPVINRDVLKRVMKYGLPMLITGLAGTANEQLNRIIFKEIYKADTKETIRQLGYFGATVKLAIMINLAIQAFKLAGEPFFFSISQEKDAKQTYARVMKWFVVVMALMFLNVLLFMDVWQYFIAEQYRVALNLVPVLLLSYIFLGIYYNLNVWFKLTDKTIYGTYITLVGTTITVVFNFALIPVWGYAACAWGMLASFGVMMTLSFFFGQKHYPIPYNLKKIGGYLAVMLLFYAAHWGLSTKAFTDSMFIRLGAGAALFVAYFMYIVRQERDEMKRFPVIGKFLK
ncbi:MAG: oligosaccharide flippase family protein [Chitinophagales bacterium]|nr:oligosaccharide flippase family protein [Chitinophagaceae bacterium]MCB9065244.1 oligosaccharide flippase family protein [Chitinophagales bacterium]